MAPAKPLLADAEAKTLTGTMPAVIDSVRRLPCELRNYFSEIAFGIVGVAIDL